MNAARRSQKRDETRKQVIDPAMKKPLIYSTGLHITIAVLATVGLPFLMPMKTQPEEMAITVELADLGPMSESPVVDQPNEAKEPEPTPPKPVEQKPVYKKEEAQAEPPDDLLTPRAPDVEEVPEPPEEKIEEKPPEPEKLAEVKPPPKPMNKPKPPKPKPEKPKEEKPKEEKKKEEKPKEEPKEQEQEFTSLLKSLAPDQETPDKVVKAPPQEEPSAGQTAQLSNEGRDLTRSEADDLNRGVEPCWNLNAGGKFAENLVVSLVVTINPDMSVQQVQIIDQGRYNSDSHFRAAADAARRALLNPNCRNLRLPPEKYEAWKVFKYNFDPSMML